MSVIKKNLLIAFTAISASTNLYAMDWFYKTVVHPALKTVSPSYLNSHLNQDATCKTLMEQGETIPSERSLDTLTSEMLKVFINRKRDAHKTLINYLHEGKVEEAEGFSANIEFHLIQPLVRLYAVRHIEKLKKQKQADVETLDKAIFSGTKRQISSAAPIDSFDSSIALSLHSANNDKSGFWHWYNKWYHIPYRLDHLKDEKTIKLCKELRNQAALSPSAASLDNATYIALQQFSERCLLASTTIVDLLNKSDGKSLAELSKLYQSLTQKENDIHDILCPVIQLFALRSLIQYRKTIMQTIQKIDNNVLQEEPTPNSNTYPVGASHEIDRLKMTRTERETEYTTMRDALLEKMNPTKKSPTASPIRKDSAPTEPSNPLPIPTPQNTSPAKSAGSLPKATILVPEAPIASAMPIMPTPAAPRKPSPKTTELLADLASAPLPIPPMQLRSNANEQDASGLSYPPSSTSVPSTSPESTTPLLASSVPEKANSGRSLMSRKKDDAALKRLQEMFPDKSSQAKN